MDLKQLKELTSLQHECDLNMAYTLCIVVVMMKTAIGVAISIRVTS